MKKIFVLYALVLSIPLALGAAAAQADRFDALKKEMAKLEAEQQALVDTNKQLLTDISGLTSPVRIEEFARDTLMLDKKEPEEVLQIHIYGRRNGN
ncbi:MAG: septum formation initiator family protein [Spirochaetaceae bacterium]|jgi:cell division protein FtsB|nr:septum formation initiator family protein [Spirochaetaceae bacterium]